MGPNLPVQKYKLRSARPAVSFTLHNPGLPRILQFDGGWVTTSREPYDMSQERMSEATGQNRTKECDVGESRHKYGPWVASSVIGFIE